MSVEGAFFQELCAQTHVPMFVVKPSTGFRFVYVNPAGCRHFGRPLDELRQLAIADVDPSATAEGCVRFWQQLEVERRVLFRTLHRSKDGLVVPVEVMSSILEVNGAAYFIGHVTDLSERLAAERERERFEAERRAARHIDGLVEMAGALAHDFNNMLVGVLANAGFVKALTPADSPEHGALVDIEEAARVLAASCRQLLAIAGRGRVVSERIDVRGLLEGARAELRAIVPPHVALEIVPPGDDVAIVGHDLQIVQALSNLVKNAAEAVERRGRRVSVNAGVRHLGAERLAAIRGAEGLAPGSFVFLEVADDGPGIDASMLVRLFEPLTTTRSGRRGLGLAAVLGIAVGHGGGVEVETGSWGARLRIWLPEAVGATVERPRSVPPAHAKCVLVVDDEAGVRRAVSRILATEGYEVEAASDGFEALATIERREDLACVLLDLTMPRMDGRETLRRIRALRPDLPVIVTSGFDARDAASDDEASFAAFLPKPFDPESLSDTVSSVLRELPFQPEADRQGT